MENFRKYANAWDTPDILASVPGMNDEWRDNSPISSPRVRSPTNFDNVPTTPLFSISSASPPGVKSQTSLPFPTGPPHRPNFSDKLPKPFTADLAEWEQEVERRQEEMARRTRGRLRLPPRISAVLQVENTLKEPPATHDPLATRETGVQATDENIEALLLPPPVSLATASSASKKRDNSLYRRYRWDTDELLGLK
ncbi:uncharacterized protein VTP21DRAFT_1933 [Calcarisporiella thermophila]|uniref:uncharacterized protein n=1 Tax=Calcarisporiella thermophila TaxID=911321 RepID=UPI0037435893